jgi:hypothetical protein
MAKQKKTQPPVAEATAPPVTIAPISISETSSPKAQLPEVEIPAGHVLIVALDTNGEEITGSGFFYPEKTYKRFYSNETKFSVKKKVQ